MRQIGILGGTFNPPHTRHLMIAQCALFQYGLEKVLFIPSGCPPHKSSDILDKEVRYEMVAAAVADNPAFEPSRMEIDRPGITWSIDTLRELQKVYGAEVQLNFIVGEDNVRALQLYDRRAEFLALCRLLVSPRDHSDRLEEWRQLLPEAKIEKIECPLNGVSSTLIRAWIRSGQPIRYLVPPAVAQMIETRGLYKTPVPAPVVSPQPDALTPPSAEAAAQK